MSHTDERKFDREDERVVRTLAQFASAGWQLWDALEAAEEANHRKDEFVAMVGHERRNPLAAICNAAHILQEVDTAESNLTIIALSGYGQTEDYSQSKQAGCDAHRVKPVHPNVLRSMLGAETPILSSI